MSETAFSILSQPQFRNSVIGFHISKNGITVRARPVNEESADDFYYFFEGSFTKKEIIQKITDFSNDYLSNIKIFSSSISFPGPIENDTVLIPNYWVNESGFFSKEDFKDLSFYNNGIDLINEMEALGYGLLSIDEFYGLEDDFVPLWKPPSHEVMPTLYPLFFSNEPSTVLQIAHGLGAAFLIPFNSSDSYRVIPSEWGHSIVQLCGPEEQGYSEELNLIDFISQKKNGPVEWEDICSSRGLCYCYEFEAKETISEDIIKLIENDESDFIASKALANHFKFLMRFARMCAIGFTCNSVFIHYSVFNGGVQCLQKNFVQCREEFMHFTKGEWVSNVSVFIQTSNNNLSGNGVMYHSLLKTSRSEVERVNLSFL